MTEQKFKVGDKVRWTFPGDEEEGIVDQVDNSLAYVTWERSGQDVVRLDDEHLHLVLPLNDVINHPSHYTAYKGVEIIDLTEQMNFNLGNVVKYVTRAGLKNKDTEIEDLSKAKWYLEREIARLEEAK